MVWSPDWTVHHRSMSHCCGNRLMHSRPGTRLRIASGMPLGPTPVRHLQELPSANCRGSSQSASSSSTYRRWTLAQESRPAAPTGKVVALDASMTVDPASCCPGAPPAPGWPRPAEPGTGPPLAGLPFFPLLPFFPSPLVGVVLAPESLPFPLLLGPFGFAA